MQALCSLFSTGVAALLLSVGAGPAAAGLGAQVVVADFEGGLAGWHTNDAVKNSGQSKETPLVAVSLAGGAHAGKGCLEVQFRPGKGWANAFVQAADAGEQWAAIGADELNLWVKGDGSGKQVRLNLQAWTDDLRPTFFGVPLLLQDTQWHRVAVPLSAFQESNPAHPLRLRALISLQFDGSGEIGPARLWVDDIAARNARGAGAAYAAGPVDARIAALPPARALPRLGTWGLPRLDPVSLAQCRRVGLGFGSNGDAALTQQRAFLEGMATNCAPGRPTGEALVSGLGLEEVDLDQDAEGRRCREGVHTSVFHPEVVERFCRFTGERVRARGNSPWVASFMLSSPISTYGEVHYSPSEAGQYAAFSRPAREGFRRWLKERYRGDLGALRRAWGEQIAAWEEVAPPTGPAAGPAGIDTRTAWSDFMHWYNGWLEEVTRRSLEAARRETRKPLAVMMGGPKVGPSQGISLGNVGPIVRLLGRHAPAFLNDTDAQTLFSGRYTRAACSQYGVNLMLENVGPPYLEVFHQYNMLLNVLSCGADTVHLAHWGELYDDKTWFGRTWAALGPLATRYRTVYRKSDAALFHSYLTSWYRPDRSNTDALRLYDSTNTLWHPDRGYPSWGRALASPDVVDDAMVEDGALRGRKLLVIPNGSVTVTSRKAVDAIRRWVEDGGTLVGFGSGCLAYTIESDRSLRATPGLAGMLPAAVAGAVRSAGRAGEEGTAGASAGTGTRRPASGSEGASASHGSSPAGPAAVRAASASGSPKAPRVSAQAGEDDLASGTGPRGAMPSSRGTPAATPAAPSSRRLGKGRVVLYPTPADPDRESAFVHQAMGFLAAEARGAGVRRWCDADGGPACDVNPLYCGRDQASGRHLFAIDLTRHARNGLRDAIFWTDRTFSLTFHPSLRGEAELVGITDSFTACAGGEARSDPAAHALVVRFRLPRPAGQPLRLTFGKSRSGLALAKHPLLLWDGEDLELRPTLGFGAPQTAEPIRVGADGSLSPEAISMPYLVHGEMHRGKFGRGPRFRLSPVAAGALLLRVNSVARAGAVLVVSVDGRELLRRDLPDKDAKNDPRAGEVAEAIRIPLPAGEHEVHVDNAGADWFSVDRYVFMGLR